jgi:tetratricopeptide (TPR) repeat protein
MLKDSEEDDVRNSGIYFCRPGADCALAIVKDQLKNSPDNFQILDKAGDFFMARGDYGRATALFTHSRDIPPARANQHSNLGLALALAGNFSEARREFAIEASSAQNSGDPCAQMVWTHFIEGSFSEVIRTADGCRVQKEHRSAEPILLKYFCLLRLGKQTAAEKYLTSEAENFIGDDSEHILLLEFQGRLRDRSRGSDALWIRRRFAFFDGLQSEAAGHTANAIAAFKDQIFSRKDSLIALAGRTELSRLEAANPAK